MFKDLIIILISVVSLTSGQGRKCWIEIKEWKYEGLYHSSITNYQECLDVCETSYLHCWVINYVPENWYPCFVLTHKHARDNKNWKKQTDVNSYILERECFEAIRVKPCWQNRFRRKYPGLYNSYNKQLTSCFDACLGYSECFMVNYNPNKFYPCWYNYLTISDYSESKFEDDIEMISYILDKSCLTSTQASSKATVASSKASSKATVASSKGPPTDKTTDGEMKFTKASTKGSSTGWNTNGGFKTISIILPIVIELVKLDANF